MESKNKYFLHNLFQTLMELRGPEFHHLQKVFNIRLSLSKLPPSSTMGTRSHFILVASSLDMQNLQKISFKLRCIKKVNINYLKLPKKSQIG